MKTYIPALCWAGAILGVAAAGALGRIDEEAMSTLLIVLPAIAWTSLSEPVCRLSPAEGLTMVQIKPAARRNLKRTSIVMAVYIAGIFAAKYLIVGQGVTGSLAYGVAIIPGLAMAGIFWTSGKMIAETDDEFMRMLAVRQHLIAAGFAMSVASAWGTLEMFDLVPHVGAFYIVMLWAIGIFVGMIVNRVTHGVWGQCP